MSGFKSRYPLESKSVAGGGNAIFDLTQLPDDARLRGIMLEFVGTATAAASTQALAGTDLVKLLATVDLDSEWFFVRATGAMLHALFRHMHGYDLNGANSFTASTTGATARAHVWLPCVDPRALEPNDTAVPAKLLNNKTLNVNLASSFVIDLTNDVTMSAASVKAVAHMIPSSGDVLPTRSKIAFEDWSALQANLAPGVVSHMGQYTEALASTPEQYAQFSVAADGQTLLDRQTANQLIADYNLTVPRDVASMLSAQPLASGAFMPLITPPEKYKLTQLLRAERGFRVDIDSGTATSARYYYRQVLPSTGEQNMSAATKLGHDANTVKVGAKTASKTVTKGSARRVDRHEALLPKRLER